MSRIKWSRILMSQIEPIARLKSSQQKPTIQYIARIHFSSIATELDPDAICIKDTFPKVGQVFLSVRTFYREKLSSRTESPRKLCPPDIFSCGQIFL